MEMFIVAALAGVVVGVLSGLLGIGGGVVMVPLFRLVFGLDPIAATATSLFTIIPTSLSGMAKHARNKTCVIRVGVICGLAGAVLSPIGVLAAAASPSWMVMGAAALVIAYSAYTMFKKALAASKAKAEGAAGASASSKSASGGKGQAADMDASDVRFALKPAFVAKVAAIGILAGFLSGYVGVGGGFIMVPLFMAMLGVPMRLASGTSLLAVCILAIPGAVEQGILGNIDYLVGIATAAGSMPGAVLGASLVKRVPERALRFAFAAFLLVVAVVLTVNELGLIG
ncbi:sulfite exporter TauE/SafE family protein [Slackia faecicanis]|uniref:Probable membrane transporter protein n=1 Tax=Slackia faecicanis TaxID=255723 RepID=A0A3N0AEW5_9ACTN|nr:sulfite exporter TauE/SafE family protein [Slackia faecicanis]MDO5357982.1 sulfite exporter TauE/SafE family protein [Slackia faecicanis]RNL19604.1 sulfite exporter TauE/SafE family protein [Slackia faecicanis]